MSVGDMFIVLGHETKTRYDKKMQRIVTTTNYFIPAVYNSFEEAKEFADDVKGAYHVDIVKAWNPRKERTCSIEVRGMWYYCSECHACVHGGYFDAANLNPMRFCPSCGAKVVGE